MEDKTFEHRVKAFSWLIWLILFILAARLWQLQIIQGDKYAALAEGNKSRIERVQAPRGEILDRNGLKLATNKVEYQVTVVRDDLDRPLEDVADTLAGMTGADPEDILRRLQSRDYRAFDPVPVVRHLGPETVICVAEEQQNIPGVHLEGAVVRTYPEGAVGSHVLGYLGMISQEELAQYSGYYGSDLIGKTGIERAYEAQLRGQDGWILREVDAIGRTQRVLETQDPIPGNNVVLSIDSDLQRVAEEIIRNNLERLRSNPDGPAAKAGVIIALDPWTGEILAMASEPGFDPNLLLPDAPNRNFAQLQADPALPMLHRATQGLYPPGSVFKPVTATAALALDKFKVDELYYATGRSKYGKKDWILNRYPPLAPHGWIDLPTALERSSNDFFWELCFRLGIDSLAKYARMFGFGESTGVDLFPQDKAGLVPDPEWKKRTFADRPVWDRNWYEAETMDLAIGQGYLLTTPLQVALMYSTLATHGVQYVPRLVMEIQSPTGDTIVRTEPEVARRIEMAEAKWRAIEKGLVAVVSNARGTARNVFRDFPVSVAGKTGSAEVNSGDAHGWFAGYAPVKAPEIVIVSFVENGGGGASAAAPMAREFLEYYFTRADSEGEFVDN